MSNTTDSKSSFIESTPLWSCFNTDSTLKTSWMSNSRPVKLDCIGFSGTGWKLVLYYCITVYDRRCGKRLWWFLSGTTGFFSLLWTVAHWCYKLFSNQSCSRMFTDVWTDNKYHHHWKGHIVSFSLQRFHSIICWNDNNATTRSTGLDLISQLSLLIGCHVLAPSSTVVCAQWIYLWRFWLTCRSSWFSSSCPGWAVAAPMWSAPPPALRAAPSETTPSLLCSSTIHLWPKPRLDNRGNNVLHSVQQHDTEEPPTTSLTRD